MGAKQPGVMLLNSNSDAVSASSLSIYNLKQQLKFRAPITHTHTQIFPLEHMNEI